MKIWIGRWWRFIAYCVAVGAFFSAVWSGGGNPWWACVLVGAGVAALVATRSIYQARHGCREDGSPGMDEHLIISNENVTDARIVGRVKLLREDRLTESIEDMAIVPDLKHEPDGWKIMNFRLVPRTQVET